MVAVYRLGDNRVADLVDGILKVLLIIDDAATGHGDLSSFEQVLGLFFITGDLHSYTAGGAGNGRLHTALVYTITQLHQRMPVEPDIRDLPPDGFVYNRTGTRPQSLVLPDLAEVLYIFFEVVRDIIGKCLRHLHGGLGRIYTGLCFLVGEYNMVNTLICCLPGAAKAGVHTGKGL